MQDALYSVISITAIIIHLIIHFNETTKRKEVTVAGKEYLAFLYAVLAYYIADVCWGFSAELGNVNALYIASVFSFLCMGGAVFFLNRYVVAYLGVDGIIKKGMLFMGWFFEVFQIVSLIINIFIPVMFWFDKQGMYQPGPLRYLSMGIQLSFFVTISVCSGIIAFKTQGAKRRRHFVIFLLGLSLFYAGVLQIIYPVFPVFAIGFLVGSCVLHVFVVEDERAELRTAYENEKEQHEREIEETLQNEIKEKEIIQNHYALIDALTRGMNDVFLVELAEDKSISFKVRGVVIEEAKQVARSYASSWNYYVNHYVREEDRSRVLALSSAVVVMEKLKNADTYLFSYLIKEGAEEHFFQTKYSRIGSREDNKCTVIMGFECIDELISEEKRREAELKVLSESAHRDILTGLNNRRSYEEAFLQLEEEKDLSHIAIVALDVNGLKSTNDDKGHDAGDELLKGAAEVISKTYLEYGEAYRTGGDEFAVILRGNLPGQAYFKEKLYENMNAWHGEKVTSLFISHGIAYGKDYPNEKIDFLQSAADKKMYGDKADFYARNGIDRRTQQTVYTAICDSYIKILLVNLTEDSYQIVSMESSEKDNHKGFNSCISSWLHDFATSGQVAEEDIAGYLKKTDINYLREYFDNNAEPLKIYYRRVYEGNLVNSLMEMSKTKDYSQTSQKVYLFVKNIDN